jgi:hypothetical protein
MQNWLFAFFNTYDDPVVKEKIAIVLGCFYSFPDRKLPKKMEVILPFLMNFVIPSGSYIDTLEYDPFSMEESPKFTRFSIVWEVNIDKCMKTLKVHVLGSMMRNEEKRNLLLDHHLFAFLLPLFDKEFCTNLSKTNAKASNFLHGTEGAIAYIDKMFIHLTQRSSPASKNRIIDTPTFLDTVVASLSFFGTGSSDWRLAVRIGRTLRALCDGEARADGCVDNAVGFEKDDRNAHTGRYDDGCCDGGGDGCGCQEDDSDADDIDNVNGGGTVLENVNERAQWQCAEHNIPTLLLQAVLALSSGEGTLSSLEEAIDKAKYVLAFARGGGRVSSFDRGRAVLALSNGRVLKPYADNAKRPHDSPVATTSNTLVALCFLCSRPRQHLPSLRLSSHN